MGSRRTDLRLVTADGAAVGLMVGAGEFFFQPFALALGMGEVAAGLLATVPWLVGAALQLVSPFAVARLGSQRRWVVLTCTIQAASFAPLVVAGLLGSFPAVAVYAAVSLYWGSGLAAGPAWTTWVETLVPHRLFARYFARRNVLVQVTLVVGLLGGGWALRGAEGGGAALPMFAALFAVAGASRLVSSRCLAAQSEPEPVPAGARSVPALELVGRMRGAVEGRLILYLLALQVAVQTAQPYVAPYFLEELDVSYERYTWLVAALFVAKVLTLPALGALAHRGGGARRVMWLGGSLLVPLSGLLLVSTRFEWLLLVQLLSGVAWAAWELGGFLLYFETMRPEERTSVLTTFQLWNALAVVGGSVIGGSLLDALGTNRGAYWWVFGVSAAARALALLLLLRVPAAPSVAPAAARARARAEAYASTLP